MTRWARCDEMTIKQLQVNQPERIGTLQISDSLPWRACNQCEHWKCTANKWINREVNELSSVHHKCRKKITTQKRCMTTKVPHTVERFSNCPPLIHNVLQHLSIISVSELACQTTRGWTSWITHWNQNPCARILKENKPSLEVTPLLASIDNTSPCLHSKLWKDTTRNPCVTIKSKYSFHSIHQNGNIIFVRNHNTICGDIPCHANTDKDCAITANVGATHQRWPPIHWQPLKLVLQKFHEMQLVLVITARSKPQVSQCNRKHNILWSQA